MEDRGPLITTLIPFQIVIQITDFQSRKFS